MSRIINYTYPTSSEYFSQATEDAILKYTSTSSYTGSNEYEYKNNLYMEYIHKPLNELVDYSIYDLCYDFGTDSFNEIKQETIEYILEQMHLYEKQKGKAFSYFNIICRNYLKKRSKIQYIKTHHNISLETVDTNKTILNDCVNKYIDSDNSEFLDNFINHIDNNLQYYFKTWVEQDIANAILIILRKRYNIENSNKKILFQYIKEITNAKSHVISKVLKLFKNLYFEMLNVYINQDTFVLLNEKELERVRNC
jgi:hypothetical protein